MKKIGIFFISIFIISCSHERIENNVQNTEKEYEVVENIGGSCFSNSDCITPDIYMIQSHCPYTSKCIQGQCSVICPQPFVGQKIEDKNISEKILNTYENDDLGIAFSYPQEFGDVYITIDPRPTITGHWFVGGFTGNKKFQLGGISKDFEVGRSGMLTDINGFIEKDNKYYLKYINASLDYNYEISPFKVLEKDFGKILILDENSITKKENVDGPILEVGTGNYAALLNLQGDTYPGIIMWNQDISIFPLEDFERMLHSISLSQTFHILEK